MPNLNLQTKFVPQLTRVLRISKQPRTHLFQKIIFNSRYLQRSYDSIHCKAQTILCNIHILIKPHLIYEFIFFSDVNGNI
jgi:hypothetical protein